MRALVKWLTVLALFAALPAFAASEPPARVGRVSQISGVLAFFGPGDSEWSAAAVNLPAATGGWFATDPKSRAQIRIGADSVNLSNDTQINLVDLSDKAAQIALSQGRIDVQLPPAAWRKDETFEIDIARGGVWLLGPGIYDVDSGTPDQPTRITVFEGSARFAGGGVDRVVKPGEVLVLNGTDTLTATVERAAPDDFVQWCRAHDYRAPKTASSRRTSPVMTGIDELEAYGEWATVPDYGAVWYPNTVSADWVPYRQGRWVWVEPWGWNWVDDAPWGFAPSHYGRWARIDNRWGWVPGEFVAEPVYAPALVAYLPEQDFVSYTADAGPPVGWFPLAPGELYWPTYTRDPGYIRNVNAGDVNITTITNVTKVIANLPATAAPPPVVTGQRFANREAATIVPATVVTTSRPVAPAAVAVPRAALQQARVAVRPPPAVTPPSAVATAAQPPRGPGRAQRNAAAPPAMPPAPPVTGRPERPNFAALSPAPRARQFAHLGQQREPVAAPQRAPGAVVPPAAGTAPQAPPRTAAVPPAATGQPAGPPDFSRLARPGRPAREQAQQPPAPHGGAGPAAGAPAGIAAPPPNPAEAALGRPGQPVGRPDFGHLAPAHRGQGEPAQPGQAALPPSAAGSTLPPGQEGAAARREELAKQRAAESAARDQARQRAEAEAQQKAAAEAAGREQANAREQAKQKAAADQAARQQQAQQRAAAEAAARQQAKAAQQAQQRAAAEAAAQQRAAAAQQAREQAAARQQGAAQAQQRAAAEAAARQQQAQQQAAARQQAAAQAQQRAAADAAARQQQAQQRAAAEAAARQQAQQQAAARQQAAAQAQQRAAAEAAARQQAQQQAAARQQAAAQAQQRAAAEAAARQQQAQQQAAARQQAAAQAQQRAAAEAAARQQQAQQQAARQQAAAQAQQQAAAQAAARQQQQAAAQAAARQQAAQRHAQACGHPGEPPCPK